MKIMNKEKIIRLEHIEKQLNKLDDLVTYKGLEYLIKAKQEICLLKTIFYVEEQLNEDKISK